MKKTVLLFILISAVVSAQNQKKIEYSDSILTLHYPKKWKTIKKSGEGEIVCLAPKKETEFSFTGEFKQENIRKAKKNFSKTKASIFRTDQFTSFDLFISERKAWVKTKISPECTFKSLETTNLGKVEIFEYKAKYRQEMTRFIEFNFSHKNYIYTIYYLAPVDIYEKYEEDVSAIISSLTLK